MLRSQGDAVDAINPSVELTEADRLDRLRLIRSDNVGPRGIVARTTRGAEHEPPGGLGRFSFHRCGYIRPIG
jgi:hypothetical protein